MSDDLVTYVIYDHPADYPSHYVVRAWLVRAGEPDPIPVNAVDLADTLDEARTHIPAGLARLAPSPHDDPTILESWI